MTTAAHELDAGPLPVTPGRFPGRGGTLSVGDLVFDVIHLRGHTRLWSRWRCGRPVNARRCNCSPVTVFFPGGVGKTWEDGAFEQLLGDVTTRVFDVYGDDTVIYPDMVMTPRWARNVRIWRSGASEAGDPKAYSVRAGRQAAPVGHSSSPGTACSPGGVGAFPSRLPSSMVPM